MFYKEQRDTFMAQGNTKSNVRSWNITSHFLTHQENCGIIVHVKQLLYPQNKVK